MKKETILFRFILFDLIVIGTIAAVFFQGFFDTSHKVVYSILACLTFILLIFGQILLFKSKKQQNYE